MKSVGVVLSEWCAGWLEIDVGGFEEGENCTEDLSSCRVRDRSSEEMLEGGGWVAEYASDGADEGGSV